MCGIVGVLGSISSRESCIQIMLRSLVHRGPDQQGTYYDDHFSGGMQRLAINGLDDGAQPLYNKDKSVILFYNGEIYNSKQVKKELIAQGVSFRTHSDGEVIAHLYDQIGVRLFEKIDGMFALSIWDSKRKKLILSRDGPGEKPLYYTKLPSGQILYASEVKALRSVPQLKLTLDHQSLWDFPTFLWIPEPQTAFCEIKAIPRGQYMTIENNNVNFYSYKNNIVLPDFDANDDQEVIRVVRETVEQSVKSRLLAEVPIGSFLSGGLDSSIVATIAAQELTQLDTFTISFKDVHDPYHGRSDESDAAAKTAKFIGSNHHNIEVTAESFRKNLDDFCYFGDQPFGVSSGLGILSIASAARDNNIKVLLTGDGADECFGGYSWYAHLANMKNNNLILSDDPVSFQNVGMSIEKRLSIMNSMSFKEKAWAFHYYAHEAEKNSLFSREFSENTKTSLRLFDDNELPEDFIRHDRNFYFPNEMLRKVDRMSMAFSVEGRTPFASPSVLALSNKLSIKHMIRGNELKWALRRAFEDILPQDVISRPKHGFNVPIDHWLKNQWSDLIDETFSSESALAKHRFLAPNACKIAKNMINDHKRLNGHTIFCFVMLNKWLEIKT